MKKSDALLLKIFLYGLPAVVALAVLFHAYEPEIAGRGASLKLLYNFSGLIFAVWMMLTIYLSVRLMISEPFRDTVLSKLTFLKERDEREVILTGKATKTVFLTSLAVLIFLLFLSCFQVSIYRVPPEKAVDGKTGFVSLGVGFDLLEKSKVTRQERNIFSYTGLPVSNTALILGLIILQIATYNYSMRRFTK